MTENYDPNSIKLSLEPPYRDDNGKPIPELLDIVPEEKDVRLVFEEKKSPSAALEPQLKRLHDLIASRKREFRSVTEAKVLADGAGIVDVASASGVPQSHVPQDATMDEDGPEGNAQDVMGEDQVLSSSTLNPESLMQLRRDMTQRLEEAYGSMNIALDLLNCLLAINTLSTNPSAPTAANPTAGITGLNPGTLNQTPPAPITLAPSVLTPPPAQPSVAIVNSQIGITTRDAGVRKAAGILRHAALAAAEEIERAGRGGGSGPTQGRYDTSYWATALRLRQACWALLPAPLPPGLGPALKGSNRTSRDILIGFALEGSSPIYRRVAFGVIPSTDPSRSQPTVDDKPPPLLSFPQLQNRRLRVSLRINGQKYSGSIDSQMDSPLPGTRAGSVSQTLNNVMREAQQEIVEQEIFQELMVQARYVGTMVSQLSTTAIELDVTQDMSLLFERASIEEGDAEETAITDPAHPDVITCTLVRQVLVILLTRAHRGALLDGMLSSSTLTAASAPTALRKQVPILGPVISLLRYRTMIQRVNNELEKILIGMGRAGIDATLTMTGIHEPGRAIVESLSRYVDTFGDNTAQSTLHHRLDQSLSLSGEALLRIEDRHLIQVTFQSPTLLKLHVVQSQITVHDHGQLGIFLRTDVAARVIQYVQEVGKTYLSEAPGIGAKGLEYAKSWFADPIGGYCIGRWPGGKGRFQLIIHESGHVKCEAAVEIQGKQTISKFEDAPRGTSLKTWVHSFMLGSSHPGSVTV